MNNDDPKDSHGGSILGYQRMAQMMAESAERRAVKRARQDEMIALGVSRDRAIRWGEEATQNHSQLSGFSTPENLQEGRNPGFKGGRLGQLRNSPDRPDAVREALGEGDRETQDHFKWGHYNEALSIQEFHDSGYTVRRGQTPTGISALYRRPFNQPEKNRYNNRELERFSRKADALLEKGQTRSLLEVKSGADISRSVFNQIVDYGKTDKDLARNLTLSSMQSIGGTDQNFIRAGRNVQHQFDEQWHNEGQTGNRRQVRMRTDDMTPGVTAPVRLMGYAMARNPQMFTDVLAKRRTKQQAFENKRSAINRFIENSGWPGKKK